MTEPRLQAAPTASPGATPSGLGTPALPEESVQLFGGACESPAGFTVELISVDRGGWPRVALLSLGEVLALNPATVRLALWPHSHSVSNLRASGRAALAWVQDGGAYTAQLYLREGPTLPGPPARAVFEGRVVGGRRDEVPYARLTSGITFELVEPAQVMAGWQATLDAMRHLPAPVQDWH